MTHKPTDPILLIVQRFLTAETFRERRLANSVTRQVTSPCAQTPSVAAMPASPVACFTVCSPLAHADELTSQRKASAAVSRKSWRRGEESQDAEPWYD